ncbi:MAG: preprotein translocase subunit YajC [Eubacteriales bacterium]|nr:preprotein translocase subunit YajC [Eubacteriales bacterium]
MEPQILTMIIWLVVIGAMMYFLTIRPNKKQRQQKELMLSRVAVGDSVLTTGGFYGVVIGIEGEIVIVEFGSNKNCRIPMRKEAILDVEKPGEAAAEAKAEKTEKKTDKKVDKKSEK